MTGDVVYFWIPAPDSGRARTFYGGLFGWQFEPGNVPDGWQIVGPTPHGGIHGGDEASSPQVCFGVDDITAAVERVRQLGGEADEPVESAAGWYASCRDDQGSVFYLWASAERE